MTVFESRVLELGPEAEELIAAGFLILFGPSAPPELRQVAVIHEPRHHRAPLEPGQHLWVGPNRYTITAVGSMANQNLQNLGHVVIKFNGRTEPELPGDVCVETWPTPAVRPGMWIRVERVASIPATTEGGREGAEHQPAP
ncbi:PTS sorbitol transporter subunit IIA [Thermaerobacter sp. FW80]|uniref:PTS glucitol/sorbitol transporter subunit IIA n=1 Tax=Thermaerobacter sp. FW80 TaxID=2546351 RepID=UPI0010757D13|nr:PTS glucitol/sorbitol transporter subunit IIA [Thermaerobacter sp. FW80]QBS36619.1 PTS sorbitol transporter subunit IIA [Thermaerobacter sp. FW80]